MLPMTWTPFLDTAASGIVLLTGAYLVALGVLGVVRPAMAAGFFGGFAQTPLRHGVEILVRVIIGAALLHSARTMQFSAAFSAGGWILVITSTMLACVPWQVHRRFARAAVPLAMRYLPWLAAGSVLGGAFILWAWTA